MKFAKGVRKGALAAARVTLATLVLAAAPQGARADEKVSGPLTLVQVGSVQRERTGNDQEELAIEAYDAYTRKPAMLKLRRHARSGSDLLESCEKFALVAMNRPDNWQVAVYLSSSNREVASFETVHRERAEWRVMQADLERLGGQESFFRCALQRAGTETKP